ncbi:hypothetical protein Tco_1314319 [Tanacetum coccineum]
MKYLICYMDQGGSNQFPPKVPIYSDKGKPNFHFVKEVQLMLQEETRLADKKEAEEDDAKALDALKLSQVASQQKLIKNFNAKKRAEMRKIKYEYMRLDFLECIEVHDIDTNQRLKDSPQLLGNLTQKFKWCVLLDHACVLASPKVLSRGSDTTFAQEFSAMMNLETETRDDSEEARRKVKNLEDSG